MLYIELPECLLCAFESRMQEVRRLGVNDLGKYSKLSIRISELMPGGRTPLFIESFEELTKMLNNEDPHLEEKKELERVASSILHVIVNSIGGDVIKYFEVAAAANSVDVPMRDYNFDINDFINKLLEEPIWIGITRDKLTKLLSDSKSIGYVVDNSGEFQIDSLLIKRLVNAGINVTVYARGMPYEVDITADYASKILKDINVKIISTKNRYPVFYNENLWSNLRKHDLIISKGIGNFEAYLEKELDLRTLFLFRAKCGPIIRLLKVPRNSPVIYLLGG
ncbi:MAG: ARMT1-like domain-containing protein [Vulcanisaeta sp. AZ3]